MSPFIPLQSAEAVHMGLVWKKDSQTPKISYGRPFDIRIAGRAAGDLRVITPTHQAQAVPGVYMLFVADERGVPSAGHRVDLKP